MLQRSRHVTSVRTASSREAVEPAVAPRQLFLVGVALLALAAAVFGPYVAHAGFFIDDWGNADPASHGFAHSVAYQFRVLGSKPLLAVVAHSGVPRDGTVFSFGMPAQEAPGVPVFSEGFDLAGAVRLRFRDPTMHAYPVIEGARLRCTAREVVPEALPGAHGVLAARLTDATTPYGRAVFVDGTTGAWDIVRSRAACERDPQRFRPGPMEAA